MEDPPAVDYGAAAKVREKGPALILALLPWLGDHRRGVPLHFSRSALGLNEG